MEAAPPEGAQGPAEASAEGNPYLATQKRTHHYYATPGCYLMAGHRSYWVTESGPASVPGLLSFLDGQGSKASRLPSQPGAPAAHTVELLYGQVQLLLFQECEGSAVLFHQTRTPKVGP